MARIARVDYATKHAKSARLQNGSKNDRVHIAVLAFEGCLATGVASALDIVRMAAILQSPAESRSQRLTCRIYSVRGGPVRASNGVVFDTRPLREARGCAALLIPGIDHDSVVQLDDTLRALDAEVRALRAFPAPQIAFAASCSAAFLLARAGRLRGARAATSWWLARKFQSEFPEVVCEKDQLLVDDGRVITSGGVTSCIDLTLHLIGRCCGARVKRALCNLLAFEPRRSTQAAFRNLREANDDARWLAPLRRRLERNAEDPWTIAEMAASLKLTERTFLRRMKASLNLTPREYLQRIRIERGRRLLEHTAHAIETIAVQCGYEDVSAFRKLFRRVVGQTPGEFRRRFQGSPGAIPSGA